MDPLSTSDYPHSMQAQVGYRLPKLTKEQSELVKGSLDFLGLNYYSSKYASNSHRRNLGNASSYLTDSHADTSRMNSNIWSCEFDILI